MRDYIKGNIQIDGRNIPYPCFTAYDYLSNTMTEEEIETFAGEHYECYKVINQVMALKQSCYLLRRVSYSCGSLAEDLYTLKNRLIHELKEKHQFEFDDAFVESFVPISSK